MLGSGVSPTESAVALFAFLNLNPLLPWIVLGITIGLDKLAREIILPSINEKREEEFKKPLVLPKINLW